MYLGIRDLLARWVYTRGGLYKLMKSATFPPPLFLLNQGRTKVWRLSQIETFEADHPEVLTVEARDSKIKGYLAALRKGRKAAEQATKPE